MTQKTALVLSAVLTAFVLVLGGGLVARVSQTAAAPAAAPTAAPTVSTPAADAAAQFQGIMQQREAQYRQLIDQANQRLSDMNKQLAATQVAQAAPARASAPAAPAPAQPAAPQITLSPDSARDIAVQAANFATMIRAPELVRFEGQVAYEVGFTRGVVYVDASTGAVLYNGTHQGGGGGRGQPASQPPAPTGEHETEQEHETESHD
jgi:uncharacterized membrane protein YkoI